MKRLGQLSLGIVFAALLLLSGRALISRPEVEAEALPLPPVRAVITAATETVPAEEVLAQPMTGTVSRRLLPGLSGTALLPAISPVRDGNGIPLRDKPYVRTVYTACRLEETSG